MGAGVIVNDTRFRAIYMPGVVLGVAVDRSYSTEFRWEVVLYLPFVALNVAVGKRIERRT